MASPSSESSKANAGEHGSPGRVATVGSSASKLLSETAQSFGVMRSKLHGSCNRVPARQYRCRVSRTATEREFL
jgi:hypothetical protein